MKYESIKECRFNNKLTAPRLTEVLHRSHLIKYLETVIADVIWLTAPSGSGKTTLVADWLNHTQQTHIWLTLDASDSNPDTFFYNLLQAIHYSFPDDVYEMGPFTQEYTLAPNTFADNLFKGLESFFPEGKITLILDDYHQLAEDSLVHELLSRVIESQENNIRCLVISRHSPTQAYLTLKATDRLTQLNWEDIQFNPNDTRQLIEQELGSTLHPETLASIQHETEGWVAGIRLLLSKIAKGDQTHFLRDESPMSLVQKDAFGYFNAEVFSKFDDEKKYFLITTSFMPFFTAEMAVSLSGVQKGTLYLEELVRKNLFIEVHPRNQATYRYHSLFQSFLQDYAHHKMTPAEYAQQSYSAAKELAKVEAYEHALDIFIEREFFEDACHLLSEKSETLLQQGRIQQLLKWFNAIPEVLVNKEPSLLICLGKSTLLSAPVKACDLFLKVIRHYKDSDNKAAAIAAYGLYLEALSISGKDYHLLEQCLNDLEYLIKDPSPEVLDAAKQIACVVLRSTSFVTINNPLQKPWHDIAKSVIYNQHDPVTLIKMCNNMMTYYRFSGDHRSTYHLMDMLNPYRELIESIPVLKLQTKVNDAFHCGYVIGRGEESAEICRQGIQEGIESGIRLYEFWLRYLLVLTLLRDELVQEAEKEIIQLREHNATYPIVRKADVLTLSGMCALYKGDLYQAQHDLEKANDMYTEAGANFPVIWSGIILATAKFELGDLVGCQALLSRFEKRQWQGSIYAKYQAMCLEAWIEMQVDEKSTKKLKKAFALARRQHFIFIPTIGKTAFIQLCQRALRFGIETEYVNSIITEHRLFPDSSLYMSHLWPFPLKIYTLQSFKIVSTDSTGECELTLQPKSLELLKVLIALGGHNVPIEKICDTIWQDADGDSAYKILKTTLYRLRKSLGSDRYILLKNNCLSFSAECWVDAICIWNEQKLKNPQSLSIIKELMSLYHQPFLEEDIDSVWVVNAQTRLQQNMARLLKYAANISLENDKPSDASAFLERASDMELTGN